METLQNKVEDFKIPSLDKTMYCGSGLYASNGRLYILMGNQLELYEKTMEKKTK